MSTFGSPLGRPLGGVPGHAMPPPVAHGPPMEVYGLGGDPERRLNESSARQLARLVFIKYDDNDSGFMNSEEAANLITDLYASINMEYRATQEEGKEFMKANDSDHNWQFNRQDFEEFFVRHLSTQNNFSGFNLFGNMGGAIPAGYKPPHHAPGVSSHFHREDPVGLVAGAPGSGSRPMGGPIGNPMNGSRVAGPLGGSNIPLPAGAGLPR